MKPPLPPTNNANLIVGTDLDLSRDCFAAFLAAEKADTVIGDMSSWVYNPLATWLRDQVQHFTSRPDWMVQVTTSMIHVVGPTESDSWHALYLATPRWAKDFLSEAKYNTHTHRDVTVDQARRYLARSLS